MFPFNFSPNIRYPLSGPVIQDISPMYGDQFAGNIDIEREVCASVASYGKQLGKLTEAVIHLAEQAGVSGPQIDAVRQLADDVQAAKHRAAVAVQKRADQAAEDASKLKAYR